VVFTRYLVQSRCIAIVLLNCIHPPFHYVSFSSIKTIPYTSSHSFMDVEHTQNCSPLSSLLVIVILCTRGRSPGQQAVVEGEWRKAASALHKANMKLIADKATIAACNSELEAKKVVLQGRIQALEATVAAETAERGRLASELKEPWEASPPGRASINKIFDNNATASPSVPSSLNVLGVVASTTAPLPVATKTTTATMKTAATKTARS